MIPEWSVWGWIARWALALVLFWSVYCVLFQRRNGPWDGREGREEPGAREEDLL